MEILPGNRDIWELLTLAATQWRVDFNGVYGLDYTAIIAVAQALHITTDRTFFEKLRVFERVVLDIIHSKGNARCNDAQREKCSFEFGEYLEWACKNCPTVTA